MLRKKGKLLIPIIVVFVAAVAIVIAIMSSPGKTNSKQITTVKSTLEKILETNDLQTAQIIYNAVATKKDDSGEKVQYYAAYDGTITAGIDFSKVDISSDPETNTITVTLPPAEVLECTVDPGTIEYIFLEKKAETETVAQEAYKLCTEDLKRRSEEDTAKVCKTAYDNAKKTIEGLFMPWLQQLDNTYTLVIE